MDNVGRFLAEAYDRASDRCRSLEPNEWTAVAARMAADFRAGVAHSTYLRLQPYESAIAGKVVLDIGCKFGHFMPVFFLLGASAVVGVDVVPQYVEIGRALFGALYPNVSYILADDPYLPLQSETVGFVCLDEVISHVNPMFLDVLWGETARVLAPGGRLFVSDGNNLLARYTQDTLAKLYGAWELAPEGTRTDRDTVSECFRSRRKKFIAANFPKLAEAELDSLSENTSGLFGAHLCQTVEAYFRTGALIRRPYRPGCCPTAPETGGTVMERGFYPEQIVMALWSQGLAAREVRKEPEGSGVRGLTRRFCFQILPWVERLAWTLRQQLSSPIVQVVAEKPSAIADIIPAGRSSVNGGWSDQKAAPEAGKA